VNPKVQFLRRTASERGEGKLKALIVTAILIFLVYVGVKVVPPYVSEYQLSEKMQETARFASVTRSNEDKIRETIFREIQDLDIPATKEDVKVTAAGGRVSISVDYSVPIDLMVYKFDLHFTPSSSNKDII
jgi:predicted membrane protein